MSFYELLDKYIDEIENKYYTNTELLKDIIKLKENILIIYDDKSSFIKTQNDIINNIKSKNFKLNNNDRAVAI